MLLKEIPARGGAGRRGPEINRQPLDLREPLAGTVKVDGAEQQVAVDRRALGRRRRRRAVPIGRRVAGERTHPRLRGELFAEREVVQIGVGAGEGFVLGAEEGVRHR